MLYTFDDANKSNCLARCAQPLGIRTAHLDDATQIGIVELRSCVEAIVAASPELVARLGHDYTVYAYDYSEYETPLVGQGMLSWVLASASPTPLAPAQQSKTMVTGRVCRNVLGLFSEGVKETLEVKLRLVPVPTCLQSEYLESMEKYRSVRTLTASGFDAATWTTFTRNNPTFDASMVWPSSIRVGSYNLECASSYDAQSTGETNAGKSRSNKRSQPSQQKHNSRTMSSTRMARGDSVASGQDNTRTSPEASDAEDDLAAERQTAAKRARIVKADWQGPSVFEDQSAPLRVMASTAASVRGHRPSLSQRASHLAVASSNETSNRPPTPRPFTARGQPEPLSRSVSSLAHGIPSNKPAAYESPYSHFHDFTGAPSVDSPEARSATAGSTPSDMPSSPPVLHSALSPTPSSPTLPVLRDQLDSGFASGPADECANEDDEMRPLDDEDIKVAAQYSRCNNFMQSELAITMETPGNPDLLPKTTSQHPARTKVQSRTPQPAPPSLQPKSIPSAFVSFKQNNRRPRGASIASIEGPKFEVARMRSESSTREAQSSTQADQAAPVVPSSQKGGGSGIKRKSLIREKLAASIAEGKMPPYCKNCGEVGPPTWRKAFARLELGSPDEVKLQAAEEAVTAFEPVSWDEQGRINSYRILKKQVDSETREKYEELQLCNRKLKSWLSNTSQFPNCFY